MKFKNQPKNIIVKKANIMARTAVKDYTLIGYKLIHCLLSEIEINDKFYSQVHQVPASKFIDTYEAQDYQEIKILCDQISKTTAYAQTIKPDGKPIDEWAPFFKYVKYTQGIIYFELNPEIEYLLNNLNKNFTIFSLAEFLLLRSKYSQRLFEYLYSYKNTHKTVEVSVTELHRILGASKVMRKEFTIFRQNALVKAENDINTRTTMKFTWEPIRTIRTITDIKFTFLEQD